MSKATSMMQYLKESIINHALDCPLFVGLNSYMDYRRFQNIIHCRCGMKWVLDDIEYRRNTDKSAQRFFNMLREDQYTMNNKQFKEYIDMARENREKKRAKEAEELRVKEAIRLQMIQMEKENRWKEKTKKQMTHPVFCLEI